MSVLSAQDLYEGVRQKDHGKVAQAITLLESDSPQHWERASSLLTLMQAQPSSSLRLALSGPPGVGKSTFIESLGLELVSRNTSIAVLAVDPSSLLSGGSILGDKTRMERLSREPSVFIRPSPSRGYLGGVTERLPAAIAVCESAGFDVVIVETVGVGQSEVSVAEMVDHFCVLAQPGSGDDLQGIKKGVLEFVDSIAVNKVDLGSKMASTTKMHLQSALKIMRGHEIPIYMTSGLEGTGIPDFCEMILGIPIDKDRRAKMNISWFRSLLKNQFDRRLSTDESWAAILQGIDDQIQTQGLSPMLAVQDFFKKIL